MAGALSCKGTVGRLGRLAQPTRHLTIGTRSGSGDDPSSSERDLSCSGAPTGFGSLRKGFKPQPKRSQQSSPKLPTINGRDKAEVLRDTQQEVAEKTAQVQAARAAAAAAAATQSSPSSSSSYSADGSSEDTWAEWRRVDAKVNKYPSERLFTAVGSGGDDFRDAMVKCVEDVVGVTPEVNVRPSSGGNYQSVRVGPVVVNSPDQVLEIFNRMRQDKRLKFHL